MGTWKNLTNFESAENVRNSNANFVTSLIMYMDMSVCLSVCYHGNGRQSFHIAAPVIWNSLPAWQYSASVSRGQFWDGLKAYLLLQAYTQFSEILSFKSVFAYLDKLFTLQCVCYRAVEFAAGSWLSTIQGLSYFCIRGFRMEVVRLSVLLL